MAGDTAEVIKKYIERLTHLKSFRIESDERSSKPMKTRGSYKNGHGHRARSWGKRIDVCKE